MFISPTLISAVRGPGRAEGSQGLFSGALQLLLIVIATIVVVVIVISIITIQTKLNVHSRSKQRLERGANIGCCSWTDYGGSQGPGGADRAQTPKSNLCLHLPPIPPSHHCLEQDRETINPGAGVSWNPNLMLPFYFWSNFSNS